MQGVGTDVFEGGQMGYSLRSVAWVCQQHHHHVML